MINYYFANFKMNMTFEDIKSYTDSLLKVVDDKKNKVGLFVPYTVLWQTKELLKDTNILVGAQNVHYEDAGAFTGEINASMLKECNCDMVLVGHSERRKYFKETNIEINKKIKQLMKHNIKVVFCIGETKQDRIQGNAKNVLCQQLSRGLSGIYENELENILIAYEPVWAIGTGETASNKLIEESICHIKEIIKDLYNSAISEKIRVIYGGSVTPQNIKTLSKIKTIHGFLIGGASLNYNNFAEIINN